MPVLTLRDIATTLGVPATDANPRITGVATLTEAAPTELSFLGSDVYVKDFSASKAAAVLVGKRVKLPANPRTPVLIVDDADLAIATILPLFAPAIPHPPIGIDPTARIAASAKIDSSARIGPFVVIGE